MPTGEATAELDQLTRLRMSFGANAVSFRCGPTGEDLIIDRDRLESIDLGKFGRLVCKDLTSHPLFAVHVNTPLNRVCVLKSYERMVIGCILEFRDGAIVICNWGDELKVWRDVPVAMFSMEKVQIEAL